MQPMGVGCDATAAMSHMMQNTAGAIGAAHHGSMAAMGAHPGGAAAMEDDEMWAHEMAMQEQMQHQHHQHFAQQVHGPSAAGMAGDAWTSQFHQQHQQHHQAPPQAIVDDAALQSALEDAYADAQMHAAYDGAAVGEAANATDAWLDQFAEQQDGAEWADELQQQVAEEEVKVFGVEGEPLTSVQEKDAASDFHGLMRELNTGEAVIEEDGVVQGGPSSSGAAAVDDPLEAAYAEATAGGSAAATHEQWEHQLVPDIMQQAWLANGGGAGMMMPPPGAGPISAAAAQENAWANEMTGADDGGEAMADEFLQDDDDFLKEFEEIKNKAAYAANATEYPFEDNNAYLFHDDPFLEGQELLAAGTMCEAVLAFEAAAQKDPESVEAWQFLGTTQAENEKDSLAIIALNNAVKLAPTNLVALSALATSHVNEANHMMALRTMRDWIERNEKYPGVVEAVGPLSEQQALLGDDENNFTAHYLFVSPAEHQHVTAMFETALEMHPGDAELHRSLGILFNISNQYDKAAEAFRQALRLQPDDAKLWNKLGATCANGSKPRDALEAYNRALDISPGYVRAWYNLGVAQSNLANHGDAAKAFIRAIALQQGTVEAPAATPDGSGGGPVRSSQEVWDVLRMTLNMMEKPDLVDLTWQHDVRPLMQHFGIEEFV